MEIKVIFEDRDFLVINKPAGVVVNKAKTVRGKTVQDWVEKKLKIKNQKSKIEDGDFIRRAGIVHRLDKETSGLLVVAKNAKAFENLQAQFKTRKTRKKYLALVHGRVEPKEGKIELPISRSPFDREKFGVFPGGRRAITEYRVISNLKSQVSNLTLLEVCPKTGRTHQIRVHLKYIGHPIVADVKYAGRKTNRLDKTWCPRMFLHASTLELNHPKKAKRLKFKIGLPQDLETTLGKLSQIDCKKDKARA